MCFGIRLCNMECTFFNQHNVINVFKKSKVGKSSGPDKIGGRLLKTCADQLGPVFYNIFQKSLYLQKIPKLWKEAIVVPIRKTRYPKTLNDFRPVALTSLVMKCFEKFVRDKLLLKTQSLLDPLQFAYQARRGVEDASSTLLNMIMKHLDARKTEVRLLFVNFSSHIRIYISEFKIVGWLLDFLSDRMQRVRVNSTFSDTLIMST